MKLRKECLVGQNINLDGKDGHSLGPDLTLNDCVLEIACPASALTIAGLNMIGGHFNVKKKLVNFPFYWASFDRVQFSGVFAGCDFGVVNWDEPPGAKLVACDFSQAVLDE